MTYVQGFLTPVPNANRDKYIAHAQEFAPRFRDLGATRFVEAWGDDVPDGKLNDLKKAVGLRDDETVLFSWLEWPDRQTHDAGNEKLIGALSRIKSYLDYGAYTPIQVAAAAALSGPQSVVDEIRAIYKSRRDVLVKSMAHAGWEIPAPDASMFAWAPVPERYRDKGSMEFAKDLLVHAKVAVSPGIGFGEYGEGYVRVALVENEHRIRQAARNVRKYLQSMGVNTPAKAG